MGRKNRKTAKSFHALKEVNDSVLISKQKKLEKELKEKELFENFEQRQSVNPAVSLKSINISNAGHPNATSTPMDSQSKKQTKWRSDGRSVGHKTVNQMIAEGDSDERENDISEPHRDKGKRKIFSSESSGNEQTYLVETKKAVKKRNGSSAKRVKLVVDNESDSDDFADEDEEECLGEDLEDEELERADVAELRNGSLEDEEEGENSSFIASDASIEDEIESESDEEPLELEFTGYETKAVTTKCFALEALADYTIATSPFALFKFSEGVDHSVQVATKALQWLVGPIDSQTFFISDLFQKRALLIKRKAKDYFDGFFGTAQFFEMLQKFDMYFGTDVDLPLYENGETSTPINAEGERVSAAAVWGHIGRGQTALLVRPQRYNDNLWYLCEVLQELFCSFVGTECFLTPANSHGIAPHCGDSDAFLLQVEGCQSFKVYAPEHEGILALDGNDSDLSGREPTFEALLEQGDTLYIPRGWIYQASVDDTHSLHVTVSVCRQHSFADFLEKSAAEFAKSLVSNSLILRHTLPPLLFDMAGVSGNDYSGEKTHEERIIPVAEIFARKFGENFSSYVPSYIDLMAREFFRFALPPFLTPEEKAKICFGGQIGVFSDIGMETEVKLIRKHTQRLLFESTEKAFIAHRMYNPRGCEDYPEKTIDFPIEFEDGFITLVDSYPNWVKVRELGLKRQEANTELAKLLFDNGILLVQRAKNSHRRIGQKGEEEEDAKGEKGRHKTQEGDSSIKSGKKNKKRRRRHAEDDDDAEEKRGE